MKKEKQPPKHGLSGRERMVICRSLYKKRGADYIFMDFDQMSLDEIRAELKPEDICIRDFPSGYGEITYRNVIEILGGTPPQKNVHSKRKNFRLFGRKIIISIY